MSNIKTLVRGVYDLQKLRIMMGNRIVGNFKVKQGQKPGEKEDTLDTAGKILLSQLRASHKLIANAIIAAPPRLPFKGDELISSEIEYNLMDHYLELENQEIKQFRSLERGLREYPIYTEFLKGVCGIGPAMAGVILSEIDIHKAEYPSSIHAYAGLDVASDGQGRSRKKEHLVEVTYINKDGEEATRVGITFNPFLKTKLIGVLGSSFLKQSPDRCEYRKVYDNYKHRLEHMDAHKEKSKGHRHNMAIRYMIKIFLIDLYKNWRALEGLPVAPSYAEAKLGKIHKKAAA